MAGNQQGLNLGSLNTSLGQGQLGLQNPSGGLKQQQQPPNAPTGSQGFVFPTTANPPTLGLAAPQANIGQTNKPAGIGVGLGGGLGSNLSANKSGISASAQTGVAGQSGTGLNMGLKLPGPSTTSMAQPSAVTQSQTLPGIKLGGVTATVQMGGSSNITKPGNTAAQGGIKLGGIGQTTASTTVTGVPTGLTLGQTKTITPGGIQQTTQTTAAATLGQGLKVGQGGLNLGVPPSTVGITQPTGGIGGIGVTKPSVITGVTTAPSSRVTGLGGTSINQGPKKTQIVSVSESPVPDELAVLVEGFKNFMESQKSTGEEISKVSESFDKQFKKIQNTIDHEKQQAVVFERQTTQLSRSISQLKEETNKEARIVEVAQRTRELPAGLQHENTAPDEFFHEVTIEFEKRMHVYRNQLEELESYLGTFLSASASLNNFGPSEVITALQSQHQPFLLLAARLQVVHEEVQKLKDQYLSLRKLVGHNSPDVFTKQKQQLQHKKQGQSNTTVEPLTGPSPFAASIAQATAAFTAMATAGHLNQVGGGLGGGIVNNTGLGLRTGTGGLGMGLGTNTGMGMGLGYNTGLRTGLGTGLGTTGGIGTGLGTTGGIGTGLGTTGGIGTGLGTTGGIGTGLGNTGGAGIGLGGTSSGNLGVGMGLGINSGMNTGLTVAGGTKPFQLKAPPLGKKINQ